MAKNDADRLEKLQGALNSLYASTRQAPMVADAHQACRNCAQLIDRFLIEKLKAKPKPEKPKEEEGE